MGDTTGIGWTDSTFNPWIGCAKVSPGCAHCYAETMVTGRMGRPGTWGEDGIRQRTSAGNWRKPLQWEKLAESFQAEHGHRQRVFCASLADVFEPRPELEAWRSDLYDLIEQTPSLDWQILTKRPDYACEWLGDYYAPNVWMGTSVENTRFTWRVDWLRQIPAAVRFVSAEPLLGSLFDRKRSRTAQLAPYAVQDRAPIDLFGIQWVIAGGESGPGHRPFDPDHARELRDACVAERIPFFFKQHGGATPKSGGKILDGVEWCEFPEPRVLA